MNLLGRSLDVFCSSKRRLWSSKRESPKQESRRKSKSRRKNDGTTKASSLCLRLASSFWIIVAVSDQNDNRVWKPLPNSLWYLAATIFFLKSYVLAILSVFSLNFWVACLQLYVSPHQSVSPSNTKCFACF